MSKNTQEEKQERSVLSCILSSDKVSAIVKIQSIICTPSIRWVGVMCLHLTSSYIEDRLQCVLWVNCWRAVGTSDDKVSTSRTSNAGDVISIFYCTFCLPSWVVLDVF